MTHTPPTDHPETIATGRGGILIAGMAHSGKTEVRRMAEMSHHIRATRRVRHWARLAAVSGGSLTSTDLDACAGLILADEALSSWDLDLSGLLSVWRSLEQPTFSGILALLHHEDARRHGADTWCAQVNRLEALIERVLDELPAVKVIHTIRDPRTGLGVSRRSGIVGRRGWDLASWELSAQVAMTSQARHPDRYMIVRWEDLAASPASVCEALSEFIGTELSVPGDWQVADKAIGRGVGGRRTHLQIAPLIAALGYDAGAPGSDSALSDMVDLVCYRVRSRELHRRALVANR